MYGSSDSEANLVRHVHEMCSPRLDESLWVTMIQLQVALLICVVFI
jgi:hypothetical protein